MGSECCHTGGHWPSLLPPPSSLTTFIIELLDKWIMEQKQLKRAPYRRIPLVGWEPSIPGSQTPCWLSWWVSSSPSSSSYPPSALSASISTSDGLRGTARILRKPVL